MNGPTKGEIDQGLAFLELHEETLLLIEAKLRMIGYLVTSSVPVALMKPFEERNMEGAVRKALASAGGLLGVMTACSRQLGAERDGAALGLFDGRVSRADEGESAVAGSETDELAGVPEGIREAVRQLLRDIGEQFAADAAPSWVMEGTCLLIDAGTDLEAAEPETVGSFVDRAAMLVGAENVGIEGQFLRVETGGSP